LVDGAGTANLSHLIERIVLTHVVKVSLSVVNLVHFVGSACGEGEAGNDSNNNAHNRSSGETNGNDFFSAELRVEVAAAAVDTGANVALRTIGTNNESCAATDQRIAGLNGAVVLIDARFRDVQVEATRTLVTSVIGALVEVVAEGSRLRNVRAPILGVTLGVSALVIRARNILVTTHTSSAGVLGADVAIVAVNGLRRALAAIANVLRASIAIVAHGNSGTARGQSAGTGELEAGIF